MKKSILLLILLFPLAIYAQGPSADFVFGDPLPDAPELSARGVHKVGVQTLDFVNKGQVDILNIVEGKAPLYDRPIKVEVWYPASLEEGVEESIIYDQVMGTANDPKRPLIPFTFKGRAVRDAKPNLKTEAYPLVIVSHGYVGSRFLQTYLTENLASKGYVVVAIDHTESTFQDANKFESTLLNRSKDISFVLNQIAGLGESKSDHFLSGLVNADQTALIGYSMGGYGVLNAGGAGYSDFAVNFFKVMTKGGTAIESLSSTNVAYQKSLDPRIKAIVAFAPWGKERGVWDAEGMKGLKIPTFFIAGDQDDISGYEKGIKALYTESVNADRYLLTYANARHNIAPNPPPVESLQPGLHFDEYYRYAEPAWDERRINNINQHFITAFLGVNLRQEDFGKYLDLNENANKELWTGFKPRSCTGLELLHALPE